MNKYAKKEGKALVRSLSPSSITHVRARRDVVAPQQSHVTKV